MSTFTELITDHGVSNNEDRNVLSVFLLHHVNMLVDVTRVVDQVCAVHAIAFTLAMANCKMDCVYMYMFLRGACEWET